MPGSPARWLTILPLGPRLAFGAPACPWGPGHGGSVHGLEASARLVDRLAGDVELRGEFVIGRCRGSSEPVDNASARVGTASG